MNYRATAIAISSLLLSFLAVTNPDKEDYVLRIKEQSQKTIQDEICQQEHLLLELQKACKMLSPILPTLTKPIVYHCSCRQTYILFSTYTTEVGNFKTRTIGIGGQFFEL
ncbi:DUF4359 domain-containing protein [Lusitaniella coriacea LEGE 07157]|uniref:DUF4359 domain-containing protein n=1 Tax=Lusitaniella coriacea LEGE 07157 TaxID=945747 RepID=A0A8J7E0T8_9CYAN|nr:DUF4359 domain-containing protein [Lusitaniella coriacea]MBE9118411.1 DUF4359 domain-containing protein [Lusitaniella coriacea LEGE 07157]